ncbi:MAG: hypothetical protein RJA90_658, partial [Bacteroidota bacterium]
AAFVLVASEEMVKLFNWQPIARMVSCSVGGVDPLYMGMGPCAAIPKALKSAGLSLSDIDLVELNEAFAAQALAVIKEGCLNPESVNVNGGAVALGHPLGCTGAKLTTQLINELGRQNKKYGMTWKTKQEIRYGYCLCRWRPGNCWYIRKIVIAILKKGL